MFGSTRLALFSSARASSSRSISTTSALHAATAAKQVMKARKAPFYKIDGPFKTFKPITPGIRHLKQPYNPHLYNGPPIRVLTVAKRKTGGRNKAGRITVRSVGGGHKQRIRILDFHRAEAGKCDVIRIEFDPRRSAHIALIRQRNPDAKQIFSYILAPEGLRAGDVVESFRDGIPDGLVDGFTDERKRVREPGAEKKRKMEKVQRVDLSLKEEPAVTAEVVEPVLAQKAAVEEFEEGSVAQLEAELAALEAQQAAEAAALEAQQAAEAVALEAAAEHAAEEVEVGEELPSLEAIGDDVEPGDGLSTEGEFLPDPAAPADPAPADAFDPSDLSDLAAAELAAESGKPAPQASRSATSTSQLALGILRTIVMRPGNVLPLRLVPAYVPIHNISLHPFGPAKLVRSAGTFGEVVLHEENGKYSHVRLQSGEIRKIGQDCCATIGKVSNEHWKGRQLGKAGRSRNLGIRPHVRGMAMNAVDHPHGGGRGKSKGNKHPRSIYGWLAKGKRTRVPGPRGHKGANRMVVKQRPRGKDKKGKV